ncbi:MAG: FAD/NAD-binding family oxidoreductase [Desulfohalobiaceae bacterium]|nr:FAD/NAD-binding family oxidoreductase [Desulfohalobiaceae bacterium]
MPKTKGSVTQVIRKVAENKDVVSLYFAKPKDSDLCDYRCGQFLTLSFRQKDGTWSRQHPFTLSSAPEDDFLRVTIKRAGSFTRTVQDSVEEGDEVLLAGSFGRFCQSADYHGRLALIAGGVGITPFLSVLRHLRATDAASEVVLFWANRTWQDVFARREFEELGRDLALRVVHVLSREKRVPHGADNPGEHVELGHIDANILRTHAGDFGEAGIFLCGPPAMQEAVLAEIEALGVSRERVDTESFVYSSS